MKIEFLSDYNCLLTYATFFGSIAIFTEYLPKLKAKHFGERSSISRTFSKIVYWSNYSAILLVWLCLAFLLVFSNTKCNAISYVFVAISLLFATLCIMINIVLTGLDFPLNNLMSTIKDNTLTKSADRDIELMTKEFEKLQKTTSTKKK